MYSEQNSVDTCQKSYKSRFRDVSDHKIGLFSGPPGIFNDDPPVATKYVSLCSRQNTRCHVKRLIVEKVGLDGT